MKHILFTLKGCDSFLLDDEFFVKTLVYNAAFSCDSTLLALNSHKFEPQGVTCLAMLSESHISIHTWPEKQMAVCDIFTCGDCNPVPGFDYMTNRLHAGKTVHHEYIRPFDEKPTVTLRKPAYPPTTMNSSAVIITE